MSAIEEARENVMWGVRTMCERGYVLATGGNISSRVEGEEKIVITPSSREYDSMKKEDFIILDMDGKVLEGKWKPSVETPTHRMIYVKRPDVKCVIHEHSKFAIAAASLVGVTNIPAFSGEILGYFGGEIPIAPFVFQEKVPGGTVAQCLGDSMGILLANHGVIGVGATMREAMKNCDIIEKSCEIFMSIRAAGELKPIPDDFVKMFKEMIKGKKAEK